MDLDREGDAILVALRQMGYCHLKSQQESVTHRFLKGKDVLCLCQRAVGNRCVLPLVWDGLMQRREARSVVISHLTFSHVISYNTYVTSAIVRFHPSTELRQ